MKFKEFLTQEYHDFEVNNLYFHNKDLKVKEVANRMNRSIGNVYRTIRQYGGQPNRAISNAHNVLNFANSGLKIDQIAQLTGYSPRNVRYIIKKHGIH